MVLRLMDGFGVIPLAYGAVVRLSTHTAAADIVSIADVDFAGTETFDQAVDIGDTIEIWAGSHNGANNYSVDSFMITGFLTGQTATFF